MYALNINEDPFNVSNDENYFGIIKEPSASYNDTSSIPDNNDQLADQITTLAGQINAANYRFLKLIAEFDRRNAWVGAGIRSCAHWLSWKCGLDMGAAREKVRVAKALAGLPKINIAFEKGELSFSKVRAMTRAATDINEPFLLMIAEYGTTQHMETLVKSFRTVSRSMKREEAADVNVDISEEKKELKQQDIQQDDLIKDKRSVTCYQDDDGMWIIHAKLPAEEGGLIAKVLQELGDRIADAKMKDETPQSSAKNVSAETFLPSNLEQMQNKMSEEKPQERLTFPQRRADALVAIAEHYLASSHSSLNSLSSLKAAERCQLVLHVRAGSLSHGASDSMNSDTHLDGRWLIPNAARRMACDAGLLVVEEDEVGNVLNIGRRSRIIPPAMSRALAIRDGGCQFPGCCETRYVEGHHIKHWADGGETKLDNLVTLCRHHHRELHKGSFFIALKPQTFHEKSGKPLRFVERLCFSKVDRYFNAPFNKPDGFRNDKNVIAANPAKFTCACCDFSELEKTLPSAIDEKTAVTKWTGESMDLCMAIDGLLSAGKKRLN